MRIKDSTGREYITFGDIIKLYDGNKLTVEKSSSNIVERYNTLDFLLNRLLLPNAKIKKKEQKGLDGLKNEKEFLEYVLKVCDRFKIDATKEIEIVNKAQIEYRLNNYELSPETKENLYKIKFDKETSQSIQCGISILIEDYNGFENGFMKLNTEEKKQFERYPIYDLYLKRYLQKS